jgi:peptide/nickel transport system substrate-binding protein
MKKLIPFMFGMLLVFLAAVPLFYMQAKKQKTPEAPAQSGAAVAPGPVAQRGGTLIFGRGGDTVGLDPAYESDGNSFLVCDNIFETLVDYADETTEPVPGLAESWEISPDGLTYTFHLRPHVFFHDRTELDANAVVFSIGRMMKEPQVKWDGQGYVFPAAKRVSEYWRNMKMDDIVAGLEAQGKSTVVIRLRRPEAPFLANLGMNFCAIISPKAYLAGPGDFAANPVGTGPFRFIEWQRGREIVLTRHDSYWDKSGGPYLDKVVFTVVPGNALRFAELKAGRIHICQFPDPGDLAAAEADSKLQVPRQAGLNLGYLGFNFTKPLWQDRRLRSAVAHAINRPAIVAGVYGKLGQVAQTVLPSHMWGYHPGLPGYQYDPDLARRELAEAGYPEGRGLPEISLWSMSTPRPYNPDGLKVGLAMAEDLQKVGFKVNITSYDWGVYLERQQEQPPDMDLFQLGWNGDNGDPDNFLSVPFDGLASPTVRNQWKNDKYHELMVQGRQTVDREGRSEIYRQAQKMILDEVVVVPVAQAMVAWPMVREVMGFRLHPTGSVRLKNTWLNRTGAGQAN